MPRILTNKLVIWNGPAQVHFEGLSDNEYEASVNRARLHLLMLAGVGDTTYFTNVMRKVRRLLWDAKSGGEMESFLFNLGGDGQVMPLEVALHHIRFARDIKTVSCSLLKHRVALFGKLGTTPTILPGEENGRNYRGVPCLDTNGRVTLGWQNVNGQHQRSLVTGVSDLKPEEKDVLFLMGGFVQATKQFIDDFETAVKAIPVRNTPFGRSISSAQFIARFEDFVESLEDDVQIGFLEQVNNFLGI